MNATVLQCPSLVSVVRRRALNAPDKLCCTFLYNDIEHHMTYGQLDKRARAIASTLQYYGAQPGDRILLLFSSGLSLIQAFFGCLYAGCIAVPVYPPLNKKPLEKTQRIINNAKPRFALMTAEQILDFAVLDKKNTPHFARIPCIAIDAVNEKWAEHWDMVAIHQYSVAFLQYTSGSTMHPKGVIINHRNLVDNIDKILSAFDLNEHCVLLTWLPPHHSTGLIGSILTPIYGGVPIIMMTPESFLHQPVLWLKNITKYKVTISSSPNFGYDYCVKQIKEKDKIGLDLTTWSVAINSSEPVRLETMEHFYEGFKECGFNKKTFYPCYGLSEATLLVTGGTPGRPYRTLTIAKKEYRDHRVHFVKETGADTYTLVSSGKMIQKIRIVDPETLMPCDQDQIGEIWIHGESVAQGYWQNNDQTEFAFQATINGEASNIRYLRTGDLGFIHAAELYVTGRIHDLIKLYGKNHYPQDIEYTLLHDPLHAWLGHCAVFLCQEHNEYNLTLLCEVDESFIDPNRQTELFNSIFELIYQVHQLELHTIVLIPLKSMPHTANGTIRRSICQKRLIDKSLPVIARWEINAIT
ncbi:MAG TPA: fatty acyl-AMP ligase [Legionella sp.]|nr:fatty acyl-AMP ligase [Legionella sp.]